MVSDNIIETYEPSSEEFVDIMEEASSIGELKTFKNDYATDEEISSISEAYEIISKAPDQRIGEIELQKKEAVSGVEYHGSVYFETRVGEYPDGSTDWSKGKDPNIEIMCHLPEEVTLPASEQDKTTIKQLDKLATQK